MDPYASFLRQLFRLAGELWFQRVNEELWKFSEPFYNWLYELFEHPRRQWREDLAAFLAEQAAEGRTLEPQSKRATLEYLIAWEATVDWAAMEREARGEPNLAVLGPLEGAMLDGSTVPPDFQIDPRELGLDGLPEGPVVPPPDVGEPELPPLVSSAEDYRRRQIAAHGDSSLTTALVSLNQAINRYLFRLEDRHEALESPSEQRANDVADFAAGVAELSMSAAGGVPGRRLPKSTIDPIQAIDRNADIATQLARRAAARGRIHNKPQVFGNRAHLYFKRLNRRLQRRLEREGSPIRVSAEEFRDRFGNVVRPNTHGSIGADVVVYDARNATYLEIFDLKTHGGAPRPIASTRQAEFRARFGSPATEINRLR